MYNVDNNKCMFHRCQSCSEVDDLKVFLHLELFDFDNSKKIAFNQWKATNRTKLTNGKLLIELN